MPDRTTPFGEAQRPPEPRMTMHVFTVDRHGRVTRDHGIRAVSVGPNPATVRGRLVPRPGNAAPLWHG